MRRLIICCDGTWNTPDQQANGGYVPTNVVKVARLVEPVDPGNVVQLVYYQAGVGTFNRLDRITGGAFGSGLRDNIERAYRFIVNNYQEGDELYLIGFSRGAYTARSLGGLIRNCGVVRKECITRSRSGETIGDAIDRAMEIYYDKSTDAEPDGPVAKAFRENHCSPDVNKDRYWIKCIAVWDTVGALGVPLLAFRALGKLFGKNPYQFHDVTLSSKVEHGYHALAIHERRSLFGATIWQLDTGDGTPPPGQTVEQRWFVGVHSDVGGGYAEPELSLVALEWMVEKLAALGVAFNPNSLKSELKHIPATGADLASARLHKSWRGVYRLWFPKWRPLREAFERPKNRGRVATNPTESLHPSVCEWLSTGPEVPENLREYLARHDCPCGGRKH